ncbi:23S rRNA (guanine(1835)-N(2))-methyltransferase, partial [Serratia nematodiphila]
MSQLDLGTQQLELERYPQQEESTQLQAWEAADEYLLQQLENVDIGGRPVLIFNDNFGTLACALHAHRPYSVSDSYMSQLATRHNLKLNGLDPEQVTLLDSLA